MLIKASEIWAEHKKLLSTVKEQTSPFVNKMLLCDDAKAFKKSMGAGALHKAMLAAVASLDDHLENLDRSNKKLMDMHALTMEGGA